jgi:peptidoglycan/LPS O-acetylase OafA/YrhL
MAAEPSERLHALDAVRGFALLLGIVFHATMSFLPAPPGAPVWIVMDNDRSQTLSATFFVLHMFRMTTFFLIAGFFAHLTFHRRGQKAFIKDRLKRIGIPLVAGWPILLASIIAVTIWGAFVMNHGVMPKGPPAGMPPPPFLAFPLTHLWFLYVLLIFYAVTLLVRGLVAAIDRAGRLRAGVDRVVSWVVASPLAPVILAVPAAAVLYTHDGWMRFFGIPTPDNSLIPNTPALVAFGLAFGMGWLIHRQAELIRSLERWWPLHLAIALAATAGALAIVGFAPELKPAAQDRETLIYAGCYALAEWSWTFAAIGMALKFLSGYSPLRRYIADSSYWLYLIHLPLVMALQVMVSQLAWPWPVKFAVILGVAFPLMFASYNLMVRHTFIGAVLNGKKQPRPPKRGAAVEAKTAT